MIAISNNNHPYTLVLNELELKAIQLALSDAIQGHEEFGIYSSLYLGTFVEGVSEINGLLQ